MATYGMEKNEFNSYVGSVLLSVENVSGLFFYLEVFLLFS